MPEVTWQCGRPAAGPPPGWSADGSHVTKNSPDRFTATRKRAGWDRLQCACGDGDADPDQNESAEDLAVFPVLAPSRLPSSGPPRERPMLTAPMTTAAWSGLTW
jgi:hypothetical protein